MTLQLTAKPQSRGALLVALGGSNAGKVSSSSSTQKDVDSDLTFSSSSSICVSVLISSSLGFADTDAVDENCE